MPLLGVNLRKISVERNKLDVQGQISLKAVKNNINLKSIDKTKISSGLITEALIFTFEFTSDYALDKPKGKSLGSLSMICDIIFSDDPKVIKKILSDWGKKKKIEDKVMFPLLQAAFDVMQVEAIYLSRKVLLPSPVQLPKLRPPSQQGYIG